MSDNHTWITPDSITEWIKLHRTHLKQYDDVELRYRYCKEIEADYELIKPFLPAVESVRSILDIGCGLAGIDILLQQHYPNAKLYLLDGDGPSSDWGAGWNAHFKPFNSMRTTYEFLALNGVEPAGHYPCDTQEPLEADLVVSFLSWGFHYRTLKYRVRTPCAIATIRKGQWPSLEKKFIYIQETEKYLLGRFPFDNLSHGLPRDQG